MKKLEAIIRSSKFEDVQDALHGAGVDYFTYIHVKDKSLQKPKMEVYRGSEVLVPSLSRILLEIILSDQNAEKAAQAILSAAQTGELGDGKIIISSVDKVIRMRNGEEVVNDD